MGGLELIRGETDRLILQALRREPSTEAELRAWMVMRSSGKLRRHLEALHRAGAIERRRVHLHRRRIEYRLTDTGDSALEVMQAVHRWLRRHPDRELRVLEATGWRAFETMIEGWASGVVKHLACSPRTASELAAATDLGASRLNFDLVALRGAGIVFVRDAQEANPTYGLTPWGACGIGVLALGAHLQRRGKEGQLQIHAVDASIALAAMLPLAEPRDGVQGVCSLTVEPDPGSSGSHTARSVAVRAEVRAATVRVSRVISGQSAPDAWIRGTIDDWLALAGGRQSTLDTGGDRRLGADLLSALRTAVCGPGPAPAD